MHNRCSLTAGLWKFSTDAAWEFASRINCLGWKTIYLLESMPVLHMVRLLSCCYIQTPLSAAQITIAQVVKLYVSSGMQSTRETIRKIVSSRFLNKFLFFTYGTRVCCAVIFANYA